MLGFIVLIAFIAIVIYLIYISNQFGYNTLSSDLRGKFIIITGASSGLGEYTAIEMVKSGATVIFACRSEERANKSIEKIPNEFKQNGKFVKLDLCSFASIKSFCETIKSTYPKIDILINNAGAQPTSFEITEDNMESYLQGNHIGSMYLTLLLLDHFAQESKVICVSSCCHYYSDLTVKSPVILSDLDLIKQRYFKNFGTKHMLYSCCKLMNIYFALYLAELFKQKYPHIKSASLHPGAVNTNFFRHLKYFKSAKVIFDHMPIFWKYICKNTEQGSQTHLYLCHIPFDQLQSGGYYVDCQLNSISRKAKDSNIRKAIMDWSISEILKRTNESDLPEFRV